MKRREFITLLGGAAAAWPLAARAQQPAAKVPRIGFLGNSTADLEANLVGPFRDGLRALGYEEGRNIVIEYRWAEGEYERFPALIAELVASNVDVIVTAGTPASLAVKKATTTIPLVMVAVGDPVATGLVASLARPGGNITGLTSISSEMEGKRLELLREVVPKVSHIAVLWNAASPITGNRGGRSASRSPGVGNKNAVSGSAYPGRDRRRISDNHRGASRRAPRARRSAVPAPSHAHHGLCRPRALAGGASVPRIGRGRRSDVLRPKLRGHAQAGCGVCGQDLKGCEAR